MSDETANSKVKEKPWLFKKGQVANPSGRPPNPLKEFMKDDVIAARAVLVEILKDPKAKRSDRIQCAQLLLDRHMGKPKQSIESDITVSRPAIDFDKLSDEQIKVMIEVLELQKLLDTPDADMKLLEPLAPDTKYLPEGDSNE